ncbi:MAG: YajQ family cyclic di-GMP-binding protein [Nitrospinaceae bacterium]|nr:MAG: YajQ family cyclic di-GMP-binding protein [Nitrospinaceae bacterium]
MAAKQCSFDIVASTDMAEVLNAVNQATMEMRQRYDFKGSKSEITLDSKAAEIGVLADSDAKLRAVTDILEGKLVKRKVSLKALSYGNVETASGGMVRQTIKLQQGISNDKGREIVKFVKGMKVKVQAQIMDDQVRVMGKSRDDLQEVIASLKEKDFDIAMNFTNYR